MNQPTISVCLTPEMLHLYQLENTIVVVVDVLRATSCMVTALANGVEKIIPVKVLEDCKAWQAKGLLAAAEREGKKVEGFDLDNSPFSYMDEKLKGQTIAVTTTNGTRAIEDSKSAYQILIGAFLNKKSLSEYLSQQSQNVIVLCAGWKGHVNVEDSLFAGALVLALEQSHRLGNDSALMCKELYKMHQKDMMALISQCSHVQRLKNLGIEKDIVFALTENHYTEIPVLKENALVLLADN